MKKKVLALLLALTMAVSLVTPALAVEGGLVDSVTDFIESTITGKEKLLQAKDILISLGEDMKKEIDEATVNLFQKTELVVNDLEIPGVDFQWQIKVPDLDLWVDIYDQTEGGVDLSYAMIANMLDDNDQAKIRCEISLGSFAVQSPEITVDVDDVTEPEPTPVEEQDPVVLEDSKVEIHDDDDRDETEEPVIPEDPAEPETPSEPETPAEPEPSDEEANVIDQSGLETTATAVTYRAANLSASTRNGIVVANNTTTYNVVINYVFQNGEIVADSYTATLADGSSFSATVTFPVVQGYLPYVGENQQNSIVLNYTAISQDDTINVVYKPTNVDYTVIHYKQNVDNDNYTEAERETKQGLTASTVPDVAKSYEGFYALLYEKPTIAADGSTVVEVYYDRYYYLMNFDLDGGYGVEPIYARYGTPIKNVGTPTRAGYNFQGWQLNGSNAEIPRTMPAENQTYKAVWQPEGTAKVTVVFWGENADDEEYSYINSIQKDAQPGASYTFDGSSQTCPMQEHSHSSCTLDCQHKVHTLDCYTSRNGLTETNKPNQDLTDKGNSIYTYTTTGWFNTITHYYLNIGDKWYCGKSMLGRKDDTQKISLSCIHTQHTDACYTCGKTAHTHSSACKELWTFVQSDTVTVAADGSSVVNVYYDRVEYSVQFYQNQGCSSDTEYTSLKITAKWGANILSKWPTYKNSSSWYVQGKNDTWQNSIQVMPVGGAKYWGPKTGDSTSTAYYYVEVLPGETGEVYNGVTYKLHHQDKSSSTGNVTSEDKYDIKGFTYKEGTDNGNSYNNAAFYYTRNSYTLTFNDGYNDVKTEPVKYEAPLSTYSAYVPDVPSAYEPGSVVFGGWYLNPEGTGAEYKLNEHTMPADNVLLYAKWVPVNHTVKFYLDQDAFKEGTTLEGYEVINVPHGSKVSTVPATPTNGSYTFVGWFYMENGVEKAFDFANMPVNKDLKVYGKWSSNVLKAYTIYYKIQGTDTEIAAPTTGSGLAGVTKTFEAKGGTDLYATYQEDYFPVTKSHSLTIDINATEEDDTNVYTFWYVQKDAVPYTVKYLNKETGNPVATEKTVSDNRKAVVTETFVPVSGMMPDAYQKRLVVSVDEDGNPNTEQNVIIFYYTKDTTHAYYKITHYTQNTDGETWTEHASSQAVGDIGTTYTADPMTIPGFTYDSTVTGTVASGELTANGLELKLYYTRNSYPYQVRYLEQGTGKQLAEPKNGTGKYGEVVSESAIEIPNYTAVDPTSQTLNIRIEEEATLNIITFYYTENEATINYQVVGPDGCGTVSPTSETLKVLSGTAQGSTAAANDGFRFVGWYTDAACQNAVTANDGTVQDNKFTPAKTEGTPWTDATYYAKFEPATTSLTIIKSGCEAVDENQSFIFTVTGYGLPEGGIKVVIVGNGRATIDGLTVGQTYTVTEDASWSWRYSANPESVVLETDTTKNDTTKNIVTVTNTRNKHEWLSGSAVAINRWVNNVVSNILNRNPDSNG